MNTSREFNELVGTRIRTAREKKKMTQQEVADALGVTKTAVCNWESGNRALYFDTAKKICKVLDVTLQEISE